MTRFAALRRPENRNLRNLLIAAIVALLVMGGLSLSLIQSHYAQNDSSSSASSAQDSANDSQESAAESAKAAAQAASALMVANQALACLNSVLKERATTTVADNRAQIALANATKADAISFQVLLVDILNAVPSSKSTPDFLAYIKIHEDLVKVGTKTAKTLADDQAQRDAHPLGQC